MIVIEKSWGWEEVIYNGDYCCKILCYVKPIASSLHYHPIKHETFVVFAGEFEIEVGQEKRKLVAGSTVIIAPNTPHRVRCLVPGMIIEASTHDDPADCVRLVPSET